MPETGPPTQGPQLSPDHQWIWDGSRWLPVAEHKAIFPTWKSVGAGLPAEASPAVQVIPTPPPAAAVQRAPQFYVPPAPAPAMAVPLWKQVPGTGINRYLYFVAGFLALVIVGVILSSLGTITLPWQQSSTAHPTNAAGPAGGANDAARANSYVTQLAPRISSIEDAVTLARETCAAGLTSGCLDSLVQVDNRTSVVVSDVGKMTAPDCIALQATTLRLDLGKVDAAALSGIKGVRDNRSAELQSGLSQLNSANAQLQSDDAAVTSAAKACASASPAP